MSFPRWCSLGRTSWRGSRAAPSSGAIVARGGGFVPMFERVSGISRSGGSLLAAGRATALATFLAGGCAPSLATMQPAHVAPKGHFQATAALEVGIPTGAIVSTIDAGRALSDAAVHGSLTADQERRVFEAGIDVLATPPSAGPHLALAYTVAEHLEIGVRYAGDGWRAGTRYQILRHQEAPLDLTVGVGLARSVLSIPMGGFIPILEVDDFTRWTVDVPLLVGTSRSWFRVWAGPKLLWSHFGTALRLSIPNGNTEYASFEGSAAYVGGQAGAAVGYRNLFLGVELTLAEAFGSASVTATSVAEVRPVDVTGFVVYPAFGLMGEL
jgi:hypothetical protein